MIYLNGKFIPKNEAKVSVLDRGFLFADGIYEVITVYQHKLFQWHLHWQRMQNGLSALNLHLPISETQILNVFEKLIKACNSKNLTLYIQVTRGSEESRTPFYSDDIKPTIFAYATPLSLENISDILPTRVITENDIRWQRCDIKTICLLPNILARQIAHRQGATEALLIRDGFVNEGASSNLFIVKNNRLLTAPLSPLILPGVTRHTTLALAERHNIAVELRSFTLSELYAADEIWITSSGREIQPVVQVNDQLINDGKVGPLWHKMIQYFYDYKKEVIGE